MELAFYDLVIWWEFLIFPGWEGMIKILNPMHGKKIVKKNFPGLPPLSTECWLYFKAFMDLQRVFIIIILVFYIVILEQYNVFLSNYTCTNEYKIIFPNIFSFSYQLVFLSWITSYCLFYICEVSWIFFVVWELLIISYYSWLSVDMIYG